METVQRYSYLETAVDKAQLLKMTIEVFTLIPRTLVTSLPNIAEGILDTSAYFIMNYFELNDLQAQFALFLMFQCFFYSSFYYAVSNKLAIMASQGFGQLAEMSIGRRYLTQSILIMVVFILVFYFPLIWFSDRILLMFGLESNLVMGFRRIALMLLLAEIVDALEYLITNYCNAQKIEEMLAIPTWINIGIFLLNTFLLSFTLDLRFNGWLIAKTAFSIHKLITTMIIYLKMVYLRSIGLFHLDEIT